RLFHQGVETLDLVRPDQRLGKEIVAHAPCERLGHADELRVIFDHLRIVAVHIVDAFAISLHEAGDRVGALRQRLRVCDQHAGGAGRAGGRGGVWLGLNPFGRSGGEAEPTSPGGVRTAVSVEDGFPVAVGFAVSPNSLMNASTMLWVEDPLVEKASVLPSVSL